MNILLTGASGLLGGNLVRYLSSNPKFKLGVAVRRHLDVPAETFIIQELSGTTDWSEALSGVNCIIHCAARVHVMKDDSVDPLADYREVNVEATLHLARQAAAAGVKRFIFISSIGVNGNMNLTPFTEVDNPNPASFYAQSKWEAEQGLWDIHHENGMEIVIIRPPLIYGLNAPGNFGDLIRWVEKSVPLPLGAIYNQRSLIGVDNLVDLIVTCTSHPAAANQLFLAGDGQDISTAELLRGVAKAMGKQSRLIPVPAALLLIGATFLGKRDMAQRLLGSLRIDISKARKLLGWAPPVSVEEGLKRCFIKK